VVSSEQLLTPMELARRWQVSRSKVYMMIQRRQIPFLHIGGSVRFHPEDIIAYERRLREEQEARLTLTTI